MNMRVFVFSETPIPDLRDRLAQAGHEVVGYSVGRNSVGGIDQADLAIFVETLPFQQSASIAGLAARAGLMRLSGNTTAFDRWIEREKRDFERPRGAIPLAPIFAAAVEERARVRFKRRAD